MPMDDPGQLISVEIELFTRLIDGLADTFGPTCGMARSVYSARMIEFHQMIKNRGRLLESATGGTEKYSIDAQDLQTATRLQRRYERAKFALETVPSSFLVSLISLFDVYLGNLIRVMYRIQPERLNDSERRLTYQELQSFGSIEDASKHIIEHEVEGVLRDSHTSQFKWLGNKLGTTLTDLPAWPEFVEITERRNLFVHSNGKVSRQYVDVCSKNNYTVPADIRIGSVLRCSPGYFEHAHAVVAEVGVKLGHVLWRKILPTDQAQAAESLNNTAFYLIDEGRYQQAAVLLEFFDQPKINHHSQESQLRALVNLAQAYKWQGNEEKCRQLVESVDWSATNDTFKLARAVLLDETEEACGLVRKIGNGGDMQRVFYRDWPLFRKLRSEPSFAEAVEAAFGARLEATEVKAPSPAAPVD